MASKLSEDQIRWILTLDASNAEKEINNLIKSNKQLQEANKGILKEMRLLEAAGKKESDEYHNLNGVLRENNKIIATNRESVKRLETQMGLTNLSMSQLKRRAQDLQKQLDTTSKNLHPEEWNKLQKELTETRLKMDELKVAGKQTEESLGKTILNRGAWATFLGNFYTKTAETFGRLISGMKDLVAEGINMAASADGVSRAFDALNRPDLLDNLRKATKGTVNDLDLMKAATLARDFRIPLEDMGKYLQFAQLKAQQTGESVQYMTDSIVKGLGRKSLLILDNLGLSAAEINEEMSKTGDFMSAVSSIVDKQLVAAGGSYVSEADKIVQRTIKLQNAQMKLGKSLIPLKQSYNETFREVQIGLLNTINWLIKNRGAISSVVAAMTSFIVTQKLVILWTERNVKATAGNIAMEKLQAISVGLSKRAFLAKLIVLDLYHKRCNLATAATEMFNLVIKKNPIGLLISLVASAVSAFMAFSPKVSESDRAISELNKNIQQERYQLDALFAQLKRTNPESGERNKILKQLNDLYPDLLKNYNLEKAGLEEIKKAQEDATNALVNRIATEKKTAAIGGLIENSMGSQKDDMENIRNRVRKVTGSSFAEIALDLENFMADPMKTNIMEVYDMVEKLGIKIGTWDLTRMNSSLGSLRKEQTSLSRQIQSTSDMYDAYIKKTSAVIGSNEKEKESTESLIEIQKQKLENAKLDPEATEEEIKAKNKKIAAINSEIQRLQQLGVEKEKPRNKGKEEDPEMKELDEKYKMRLLLIKLSNEELGKNEEEYRLEQLQAERSYLNEKYKLLNKFYEKAKTGRDKNRILGEMVQTESRQSDVGGAIDKESISILRKQRDQKLTIEAEGYKKLKLQFTQALAEQKMTKEQYDAAMLTLQEKELDTRLTIEKEYLSDVNKLELKNGILKANAITEAEKCVLDAEQKVAEKRAEQAVKLSTLLKDFKGEFNITNFPDEQDFQLKSLEAAYKARKEMALKNGLDTTELDKAYEQAKTSITLKGEQQRAGIRQQYGILSIPEEHKMQLEQLDLQYKMGFISEKEYEKSKFMMRVQFAKQFFDMYAQLAAQAVQSLQQSEIDNINAKYDVEIEAAKGNTDEVERLENEKAQKKLEIEKKYADISFAIKASQIIADTAVGIMKLYTDLPLPAAIVASVLLGAAGIANLAIANAERNKIKNMTLSSGGSSSTSLSGSRVITGKEEGGYIDVTREHDKKRYRAQWDPDRRGYVDSPTVIVGDGPAGKSREWVASNEALANPTVRPLIDMIDSAQRGGTIRTVDMNLLMRQQMAGFQSGGFINSPHVPVQDNVGVYPKATRDNSEMICSILTKTNELLMYLKTNGVNSYLSLTEFEKQQRRKQAAEKPFTR